MEYFVSAKRKVTSTRRAGNGFAPPSSESALEPDAADLLIRMTNGVSQAQISQARIAHLQGSIYSERCTYVPSTLVLEYLAAYYTSKPMNGSYRCTCWHTSFIQSGAQPPGGLRVEQ